jgi:iron complex transport system substrate-binding protein
MRCGGRRLRCRPLHPSRSVPWRPGAGRNINCRVSHSPRALLAVALIAVCWAGASAGGEAPGQSGSASRSLRVVSMNPSLTRMLIALGAQQVLVGVDEYSAEHEPAVASLPRVGGLFDPSLEAVVALEPDLVVVVPSVQQRDFRSRLRELGIEVIELASVRLDDILASIQTLGDRVGHSREARERVEAIRSTWKEVAREASQRPRRSAVLVLQRDPLYLVGGGSYLSSMLDAAGLDNAAAEYSEAYPRVSLEWLIAAAPQLIIDSSAEPVPAVEYWSRWSSIPAVAQGRVIAVPQSLVTMPGPDLDRSLRTLVAAIRESDPDSGAAAGAAAQ